MQKLRAFLCNTAKVTPERVILSDSEEPNLREGKTLHFVQGDKAGEFCGIAFLFILIVSVIPSTACSATDQEIVEYIVESSPDVKVARLLNQKNLLSNTKMEVKGVANAGTIGTQNDKLAVGVVLSFPLFDPKEKLERFSKIQETESKVRVEAAKLLATLRLNQIEVRGLELSVKAQGEYLIWMKQRVESALENQTKYYADYQKFIDSKNTLEKTKMVIATSTLVLSAMVEREQQEALIKLVTADLTEVTIPKPNEPEITELPTVPSTEAPSSLPVKPVSSEGSTGNATPSSGR